MEAGTVQVTLTILFFPLLRAVEFYAVMLVGGIELGGIAPILKHIVVALIIGSVSTFVVSRLSAVGKKWLFLIPIVAIAVAMPAFPVMGYFATGSWSIFPLMWLLDVLMWGIVALAASTLAYLWAERHGSRKTSTRGQWD